MNIAGRVMWASRPLIGLAVAAALFGASQSASAQTARQASAAATAQSQTPPAADPRIDTAQVTRRLNGELGVDLNETTTAWQRDLDRMQRELAQPRVRYSELNRFRDDLQRIRSEASDLAGKLQPRLDEDKAQLKLLGPAPAAGQPAEPQQVAVSRAELNYHSGLLSGAQAAINAANGRVDSLLNAVQDIRHKNFTSNLFAPIPGIYSAQTWSKLPERIPQAAQQVRDLVADWWRNADDQDGAVSTAIEALLMALVLSLVAWRGSRLLRRWPNDEAPPHWRRATAAAGLILLRTLPVAVPVMFLYGMIASTQSLPQRVDWLFYLTAQSIVIVFTGGALVTSAFAPRAPKWRLVAISDGAAEWICSLAIALAFVYSMTSLLYATTRLIQAPFALTVAVALPSSLLLAALVIALLRLPLQTGDGESALPRVFHAVRIAVWAIVVAIVVAAITGYLPLARFLAQQLIVTGSILALVYLMLLWVDGFVQGLTDDGTMGGRWLMRRGDLERARREALALPISLFLKFAVLVLSVPLIMLQWGYSWPDIRDWYQQLFFGLRIGNTEVTFGALLASVLVFGLGYAAARLFQGWLDAQVLKTSGISGSVRNSIRTGVGYVGIIVAGLVAFSYAGFNLSSIAIIAGALSVGIGFGLQNLVNNFVSGLILLVERPIRVGDMVSVGGEEGVVRKISVRSTEVETFDRANVLIPNSYFISEKVKNWTFRNTMRRLAITVGVAYGSDPRRVRDVLLQVAQDNPDVMKNPAPAVALEEFAASSLTFTLYAVIDDVNKAGQVKTDLSMMILDAFAKEEIEIPFGQTDISIRKMDWLRDVIGESSLAPGGTRTNGAGEAAHGVLATKNKTDRASADAVQNKA